MLYLNQEKGKETKAMKKLTERTIFIITVILPLFILLSGILTASVYGIVTEIIK
jgi:hypothetical protein